MAKRIVGRKLVEDKPEKNLDNDFGLSSLDLDSYGKNIAFIFGLNGCLDFSGDTLFPTDWGSKTPTGLARMVLAMAEKMKTKEVL